MYLANWLTIGDYDAMQDDGFRSMCLNDTAFPSGVILTSLDKLDAIKTMVVKELSEDADDEDSPHEAVWTTVAENENYAEYQCVLDGDEDALRAILVIRKATVV